MRVNKSMIIQNCFALSNQTERLDEFHGICVCVWKRMTRLLMVKGADFLLAFEDECSKFNSTALADGRLIVRIEI